jgi:hypothetical protein
MTGLQRDKLVVKLLAAILQQMMLKNESSGFIPPIVMDGHRRILQQAREDAE